MRKFVTLLLAAAMTVSGVLVGAAQDSNGSFADGIGSPAVWMNDQGHPMGTLEVTEVVAGWDEYDDRGEPARGYDYYAVNFTVTNIGDEEIVIDSRGFSLVDDQGLSNTRTNVTAANDSTANILANNIEIEPAASEDATLVYELFGDVSPELFVWQPTRDTLVLVDVSEGDVAESAVTYGLNAPATHIDERGNTVGSLEVTEVEDNWQNYAENRGPDRGNRYVAVHFRITNLSDSSFDMNPSNITLLDHESAHKGRSNVRAAEDAPTPISSDRVEMAPGESYEGMLVYVLFDGVEPTALFWPPTNNSVVVVILEESGADVDTGTDQGDLLATPES